MAPKPEESNARSAGPVSDPQSRVSRPQPVRFWHVLVGMAVSAALCLLVSCGYREYAGAPFISVYTEKIEQLRSMQATPDVMFVGTSRTYRHVDPAVIDEILNQRGIRARSYNLGVPALRLPELRALALEVLREPSRRPRWMVLQDALPPDASFSNAMTERGRFFRGGEHLVPAVTDVVCYHHSWRRQASLVLNNGRAILAEQAGLGRLAQLVTSDTPAAPPSYDHRFLERGGFWPLDFDAVEKTRRGQPMLTRPMLDQALSWERSSSGGWSERCRAHQLLSLVNEARDAGLGVVYFVSPSPKTVEADNAIVDALVAADPTLPILNYNRPREYPQLFEMDLWFDAGHLTSSGAELLSRVMAADLAELLSK